MNSLFRRLASDIGRAFCTLATFGTIIFVISVLATYLAIFANERTSTTKLDGKPPAEPISFLRAVDPLESIVFDATGSTSGTPSPGIGLLFWEMVDDPRLSIVTSISDLATSRATAFADWEAYLLVGADLDLLTGLDPTAIHYWPSPAVSTQATGQTMIGGIRLEVHDGPRALEYISGYGLNRSTGGNSIYAMTPDVFDEVLDAQFLPSGVLSEGFTCLCSTVELGQLTDRMTELEMIAGTGRYFYAADYATALGPIALSATADGVWVMVLGASLLLILTGAVMTIGEHLWDRNLPAYRADRLCGAREIQLHARVHALILLAFTLPALSGYLLVDLGVGSSGFPPSFAPSTTRAVIGIILASHVLSTLPSTIRIHHMCNYSRGKL